VQQTKALFDHLVGTAEQRGRDGEAECPRCHATVIVASFVQLEDPYMYKPEGEFSMQSDEQFDVLRRALLGLAGNLAFAAVLMPLRALAQASGGDKLHIGVIGSGLIGGTIGGLWVKAGHPVLFSSRHPEELKELVARRLRDRGAWSRRREAHGAPPILPAGRAGC
jgi:hypothetical protein